MISSQCLGLVGQRHDWLGGRLLNFAFKQTSLEFAFGKFVRTLIFFPTLDSLLFFQGNANEWLRILGIQHSYVFRKPIAKATLETKKTTVGKPCCFRLGLRFDVACLRGDVAGTKLNEKPVSSP